MLSDVVDLLACPFCGGSLALAERVLRCPDGHAFDVARQGYVNLLPPGADTTPADTPAMLDARSTLLAGGHLAPLTDALLETVRAAEVAADAAVLDVGAGLGHHLEAVLDALPASRGVALDISKRAAARAARAHPRLGAVVGDAWSRLPLREASVDLATVVFAPRGPDELRRVLRPGGVLVVVTPQPEHLRSLVGALGLVTVEEGKLDRLDAAMGRLGDLTDRREVRWTMHLDRTEILAAVLSGPSARHRPRRELEDRLAAMTAAPPGEGAITLSTWRRDVDVALRRGRRPPSAGPARGSGPQRARRS